MKLMRTEDAWDRFCATISHRLSKESRRTLYSERDM